MNITTTKGKSGHTLEREQGGVFGNVLREEREGGKRRNYIIISKSKRNF